MDFVTAWKAISVGSTGFFGMLGLLTEFKNKETGQITKWGRISLIGIVVSSTCGIIAQLKESSGQEESRKATAEQTLALAHKTDQAVIGIQRVLSPLDDPRFTLRFRVPCGNSKFQAWCSNTRKSGFLQLSDFAEWPGPVSSGISTRGGGSPVISFSMFFFVNAEDAQGFIAGNDYLNYDLGFDVRVSVKDGTLFVEHEKDASGGDWVNMFITNAPGNPSGSSNGKITSTLDLPGTTMVISNFPYDLLGLTIKPKNGQGISITNFEKVTLLGTTAYRCVFTKIN